MANHRIINFFYSLFFLLFIFQSFFTESANQVVSTAFSLFDELFVVLSVSMCLIVMFNNRTKKKDHRELKLLIIFEVIGLIGTLISDLQPFRAVLLDIIATSKFILGFWSSLVIFRSVSLTNLLKIYEKIAKLLTIIIFFSSFASLLPFTNFFVMSDLRFGLRPFKFIFYHPSLLAMALTLILSVLLLSSNNLKSNTIYIFMTLFPMLLTLRARSIAVVLIFLVVYIYLKMEMKIKWSRLFIVSVCLVAVASFVGFQTGAFERYYGGEGDSARSRLTLDSLTIAKESFPFGKGLATFGTDTARNFYSPLYIRFGYSDIYGLGGANLNYLTDTFWPAILGQYGIFGLFTFGLILRSLFSRLIRLLKINRTCALAFFILFVYLLIATTSSNSFFNPMAPGFAMIMAFCINTLRNKQGGAIYSENIN